jgi:exonuclease VII large subunit
MFEQVFQNLRMATESGLRMQQEMFQKWVGQWPGVPATPSAAADKAVKAQKAWAEFVADLVKKQRETLEGQFSAGLKNIEEAFHLTKAQQPEELRAKTVELWQKSFECMRNLYEVQMRDFQAAVAKFMELMKAPV